MTRLYTHTHTQQTMSHLWQCEARDLIARTSNVWFSRWKFLCLVFDGAAAVPPRTATWQQPLRYRVVSDGSRVNCSTLDQTYWFRSAGTGILWALYFPGRMITFSSSHWYFIIIVLLLPPVRCQLPFQEAIMPPTSFVFHLGGGPRAKAPRRSTELIFTLFDALSIELSFLSPPPPLSCWCWDVTVKCPLSVDVFAKLVMQ